MHAHTVCHTWSKMDSSYSLSFSQRYTHLPTYLLTENRCTHTHSRTHSAFHTHTHLQVSKRTSGVVMLPRCLFVVVVTTSWGNKRWRISLLSAIFISLPPSSISLCLFPPLRLALSLCFSFLTERPTLLSLMPSFFFRHLFLNLCLFFSFYPFICCQLFSLCWGFFEGGGVFKSSSSQTLE